MTSDELKTWIPICVSAGAFAFSLFTFVRNLRAERRSANNAIIRALQGEKESVIYIAHMAVSLKWAKRLQEPTFRTELLTALCVAWPMESSSRARSAIFNALKSLADSADHKAAVALSLKTLHGSFCDYRSTFQEDCISEYIDDLQALAVNLGVTLAPQTATKFVSPNSAQKSPPTDP
jgi:hypothetical protein